MFNRQAKGFLDDVNLSEKAISRFDDEHSAKYLSQCFSPDFIMRVWEKSVPEISVNIGCVDSYIFNNDKIDKEVV